MDGNPCFNKLDCVCIYSEIFDRLEISCFPFLYLVELAEERKVRYVTLTGDNKSLFSNSVSKFILKVYDVYVATFLAGKGARITLID